MHRCPFSIFDLDNLDTHLVSHLTSFQLSCDAAVCPMTCFSCFVFSCFGLRQWAVFSCFRVLDTGKRLLRQLPLCFCVLGFAPAPQAVIQAPQAMKKFWPPSPFSSENYIVAPGMYMTYACACACVCTHTPNPTKSVFNDRYKLFSTVTLRVEAKTPCFSCFCVLERSGEPVFPCFCVLEPSGVPVFPCFVF